VTVEKESGSGQYLAASSLMDKYCAEGLGGIGIRASSISVVAWLKLML